MSHLSGCLTAVLGASFAAACAGAARSAPTQSASAPGASANVGSLATVAAAPSGRPEPASPSAGCGRPRAAGGEQVAHAGSLQTPYLLTLPPNYDGTTPVPLVFAFHGRTRTHQSMHDTDASHLADELGSRYAVAYVKSIGPGFDQPSEQRDNLQLFDALYAHLLDDYCVDTEQVFALGHSSGALFSELLSCERSSRLRGIAAVAGAMVWPECTGRSAALLIHGEHDKVVSISRGRAARDRFLVANGCSNQTSPAATPGCMSYAGCQPNLPVEWCTHGEPTYQDTNHGWPSFASAEIGRFFGTLGRLPHPAGTPLFGNESFDAKSEPWQVSFGGNAKGTSSVKNGALCATLESPGENPWDAQVQYAGLKLEPGSEYFIDYRFWTSAPSEVRVKLGLDSAPWNEYWVQNVAGATEPQRIRDHFVQVEQPPGTLGFAFQFAGPAAKRLPLTLCIDEVSLTQAPK